MSSTQQQIEYILPECFMHPENIENYIEQLKKLILNGGMLTEKELSYYQYMGNTVVYDRLVSLLDEIQNNQWIRCNHEIFSETEDDAYCISKTKVREQCKHSWVPAGHKKNRDRVHNKANGKGKYTAYKCEHCRKFKRRYLK